MGEIHDGTCWEIDQIALEYYNNIDASYCPRLRSLQKMEIKALFVVCCFVGLKEYQ